MNNAYCKQTSIVNKYFADSGMLCYNTRLGCLTRDHQELLSSIRDVHYFLGQSFDRFPSYCFYPTKFYRDFEQSYGIVRKAVCIAPPVIFLFIQHASRNYFRKIDNPHLYCFYHSQTSEFMDDCLQTINYKLALSVKDFTFMEQLLLDPRMSRDVVESAITDLFIAGVDIVRNH